MLFPLWGAVVPRFESSPVSACDVRRIASLRRYPAGVYDLEEVTRDRLPSKERTEGQGWRLEGLWAGVQRVKGWGMLTLLTFIVAIF